MSLTRIYQITKHQVVRHNNQDLYVTKDSRHKLSLQWSYRVIDSSGDLGKEQIASHHICYVEIVDESEFNRRIEFVYTV